MNEHRLIYTLLGLGLAATAIVEVAWHDRALGYGLRDREGFQRPPRHTPRHATLTTEDERTT
jgi:hypothetical protein